MRARMCSVSDDESAVDDEKKNVAKTSDDVDRTPGLVSPQPVFRVPCAAAAHPCDRDGRV